MSYAEQCAQIIRESDVCVWVLLTPDNTQLEMIQLWPVYDAPPSRDEWLRRQLRPVAVLGLKGLQARSAFREPLEEHVIHKLSAAFIEYVRVLLGGLTQHSEVKGDSVQWLERLYALPDPRGA